MAVSITDCLTAQEESALLAWIEKSTNVPRVKDGTARLAVVGLDWDKASAHAPPGHVRWWLPQQRLVHS